MSIQRMYVYIYVCINILLCENIRLGRLTVARNLHNQMSAVLFRRIFPKLRTCNILRASRRILGLPKGVPKYLPRFPFSRLKLKPETNQKTKSTQN